MDVEFQTTVCMCACMFKKMDHEVKKEKVQSPTHKEDALGI